MLSRLTVVERESDRDRNPRGEPVVAGKIYRGEPLYFIHDGPTDRYFAWCFMYQESAEKVKATLDKRLETEDFMSIRGGFTEDPIHTIHSTKKPDEVLKGMFY